MKYLLVFFGIFLLPTDLMWLDSGELAASAWELGIAHPPGFPHQMQINHVLMKLIPFGSIAFRSHLCSLILGGLSLYVLSLIALKLKCNPLSILISMAVICSHPIVSLHFLNHEVYSGLGLILLVLIYQFIHLIENEHDLRNYLLLVFLFAFSLGFHPEIRIFLILFFMILLFYLMRIKSRINMRMIFIFLLSGIFGLFALIYLPIRASLGLMRNWGNPSDFQGFWDHFFAKRILTAFDQEIFVWHQKNMDLFIDQIIGGFGYFNFILMPILLIGLIKIIRLKIINHIYLWMILGCMALDFIYSIYINSMGLRDQQNGLLSVLLIALLLAICMSVMINHDVNWVNHGFAWVLSGLLIYQSQLDQYLKDQGFLFLINRISDQMKSSALLLTKSDHLSAGTAFLQVTEGWRMDVAVMPRQHLWDRSAVSTVQHRRPQLLAHWQPLDLHWIRKNKDMPMYWEWGQGQDLWEGLDLRLDFPLLSNQQKDQIIDESKILSYYQSLGQRQTSALSKKSLAYFIADRADFMVSQEQWLNAFYLLTEALSLDPKNAIHALNLGQVLLRLGDLERAVIFTELSAQLNPYALKVKVNLLRLYLTQNQIDQIKALIEELDMDHLNLSEILLRSRDEQIDYSNILGVLGVFWANQGDLNRSRSYFQMALALNAEQVESKLYLPKLVH